MDLAEWVAAHRYKGLLELIDQLPSTSRYYEALTNHPEYAEQLAQLPEPEDPWAPRQSEFGLTEYILSSLDDRLQHIASILIKSNGGSPGDFRPFPRPKSAIEEARRRAEVEWAKEFIQLFGFSPDDI